jgi:hypothetical protein
MPRPVRFYLAVALAVVAYDTAASLVSLQAGIPYSYFALGSYLIYFGAGFLAARALGWRHGVVAGAVAGVTDATAGWAVSWALGPGRPSGGFSAWMLPFTMAFVGMTAIVVGSLGALAAFAFRAGRARGG